VSTLKFEGDDQGSLKRLHITRVGPPPKFEPIAGSEYTIDAELVLIAMGFVGPTKTGLLEQLSIDLDNRGNIATDANSMSSIPGVFSGGDMRRGQSLVVWAIAEGRRVAKCVDTFLVGEKAFL
jgi:glutamate synthase (NADPH/NADH) small chain